MKLRSWVVKKRLQKPTKQKNHETYLTLAQSRWDRLGWKWQPPHAVPSLITLFPKLVAAEEGTGHSQADSSSTKWPRGWGSAQFCSQHWWTGVCWSHSTDAHPNWMLLLTPARAHRAPVLLWGDPNPAEWVKPSPCSLLLCSRFFSLGNGSRVTFSILLFLLHPCSHVLFLLSALPQP